MEEYRGSLKETTKFTSTQRIQPIYIWGGGAELSPIQISYPQKVGSHLEIFGQLRRHNINHHSHTISVIMVSRFEEASITNFKKINWSACQLSAISAISKLIQTIRI